MSLDPNPNPNASPERPAGGGADSAATVRLTCTICNQKGLHARAAARFVKTAGQFDSDRKSTRLNSSHHTTSRMPSSA